MGRQGVCSAAVGAVLMLLAVGSAFAVETESKVVAVTLYRDQALVTRQVRCELPAGPSELVVGDLPHRVVPESLFANAAGQTIVRAVRFRTRAVREEPREEVRQIDKQIEELAEKLRRNEAMRQHVERRNQYLDKLEQFVAPTSQVELSKGVLNARTLQELTQFSFEQRKALVEESLALEKEKRELTEQLSLLKRRRAELTAGSTRTVREAIIFVDSPAAGRAELDLSYLVGGAGWEPAFNLRATEAAQTVTVEYNATVYQMSGEDWDAVRLTLSTASPALIAKGPELAPFWVTLGAPAATQRAPQLKAQLGQYRQQVEAGSRRYQRSAKLAEQQEATWQMNVAASGLQGLEIVSTESELRRVRLSELATTEGWSVTYPLGGRISLASRSDRQMVQITSLELPCELYYVATPLLTNWVYREAKLENRSDLPLLAGPANCYLDGRFVGRSNVPMVARGQRFRTGFGLNSQMRATRELLSKTETTLGGNRQQNYRYRLRIENYGDQPVEVRLYDRIPQPTGGADLRVTLGEMSDELSKDPAYLDQERKRGILRWDIEVPARAAAQEARTVEYAFRLEFDRKLSILPLTATGQAEKAREEFKEMLQKRMRAQ